MDPQKISPLTRVRIEEVLSRHADPKSTRLPGGQLRILPVKTIAQNGPQCGLVALAMAAQALRLEIKEVSEIFDKARKLGISNQGEIFSAHWLCQLASALWPIFSEVFALPDPATLIDFIDAGKAVLVAYDSAKNYEPATRSGHGAHWALLTGYLYVEADQTALRSATDVVVEDVGAVYFFACHGKSRHMGLWSYQELRQSSSNLYEAGPERQPPYYIVPEDGLAQLRLKCVVLTKDNARL